VWVVPAGNLALHFRDHREDGDYGDNDQKLNQSETEIVGIPIALA
jgi:hypothetical protein